MAGGGKLLHFAQAIDQVVERLAGDRPVHANHICGAADFGDPPPLEVRHAVVAQLALGHQVPDGTQPFLERRMNVGLMEVEHVDIVSAELAQAVLDILKDPLARLPALIGPRARTVAEFGREYPMVAVITDRPADRFLGFARVVAVGRVDEVDAKVARLVDDALGGRLVGHAAEQQCAEAQGRNLQGAAPQIAIVHIE